MTTPAPEPVFYAIAYRWDAHNGHTYFVHAGTDKQAVMDRAEQERYNRGGKYGVAVYDQSSHEQIAYFPSLAHPDAGKSYYDDRLLNREHLGDEVRLVYMAHKRLQNGELPVSEQDKRRAMWEMPAWLWELCEALDKDGGL